MKHIQIEEGGIWGVDGFEIALNVECDNMRDNNLCKHCHSIKHYEKVTKWICPKVIIASIESDYLSAGLCLDCIIEAANLI